ncbi:MAG: tetratricopeptide repeat protein [Planctomycetota bacterium]|nr:tetratricopeptide repeat protein [Planctomycetota bacterium]
MAKAAELEADADALFAKGEYSEALQKYTEANEIAASKRLDSKIESCRKQLDSGKLYEEAKELFESGKYEDARRMVKQALEKIDSRKAKELLARIEKAITFRDHFSSGRAALEAGDWNKAESDLLIAVQNAPQDKLREVRKLYDRARIRNRCAKGEVAMKQGEYREAKELFEKALAIGDDARSRAGAGFALLEITNLLDVTESELLDTETGKSVFYSAFVHFNRFENCSTTFPMSKRGNCAKSCFRRSLSTRHLRTTTFISSNTTPHAWRRRLLSLPAPSIHCPATQTCWKCRRPSM